MDVELSAENSIIIRKFNRLTPEVFLKICQIEGVTSYNILENNLILNYKTPDEAVYAFMELKK